MALNVKSIVAFCLTLIGLVAITARANDKTIELNCGDPPVQHLSVNVAKTLFFPRQRVTPRSMAQGPAIEEYGNR